MDFDGMQNSGTSFLFQYLSEKLSSTLNMPPERAWIAFTLCAVAIFYSLYYITRFVKNKPSSVKTFQAREDPERRRVLDVERRKARERQLQRLREQERKFAAERDKKLREKRMQKRR